MYEFPINFFKVEVLPDFYNSRDNLHFLFDGILCILVPVNILEMLDKRPDNNPLWVVGYLHAGKTQFDVFPEVDLFRFMHVLDLAMEFLDKIIKEDNERMKHKCGTIE
jgi:hypothetical protein